MGVPMSQVDELKRLLYTKDQELNITKLELDKVKTDFDELYN